MQERGGAAVVAGQLNLGGEQAVFEAVVGHGGDGGVADVQPGHAQQIHVAENAGEPPEILILQIGAVRPLVDHHGQHVVAGGDKGRDVELGGHMRYLREAREGAVDPDVERGVHAVKVQEHLALVPALGQREGAAIAADGVVVGHIGRIEGNGIVDVGVVRLVVAVHLPVGRDRKLVPALVGIIVIDLLKALGRAADGGIEEIPAAVEQAIAAGQAALTGQGVLLGQIGDQAGARFLAANLQHVGVLPVGQRLIHKNSLLAAY